MKSIPPLALIIIPNSVVPYTYNSRVHTSVRIDKRWHLTQFVDLPYHSKTQLASEGDNKISSRARSPRNLVTRIHSADIVNDIDTSISSLEATSSQTSQVIEDMQTLNNTSSHISQVVDETVIEAPNLKKIILFALPAIGVWLCNPLLSLIDTSCVGLLSGTAQQAALNPATAVTDYGALLAAFMYTATTNSVAGAKETKENTETKQTMINAITLSGYVGAVLGALYICFAKPLLRLIIGNDAIDAQVFDAATRYVCIRAIGMPAAVIIGSAQSACLGLQDIRSPFYVLVTAALINFCGDMCFVGHSHHLVGGAAGAAWATTFSQYFAAAAFMKWLTLSNTSTNSSRSKSSNNDLTAKGFLSGKLKLIDFIKLPNRKAVQSFWPFFLPVTMTSIGRVSAYVAMSHVVSSSLGTLSMAANQIILSLFYCLTPVADSLNLTAQSFIPPLFEKTKSRLRTEALRKSLNSFIYAAILFGAALSCSVCFIPLFSNLFTSDGLVMSQVNTIIPYLFGVFSVHGVICAGEGFLLGCKDLKFLSRMYALYFIAMPYFMLRVKWASSIGRSVDLSSVWRVFLGYQLFRSTAWFTRLQFLQIRTEREVYIDK